MGGNSCTGFNSSLFRNEKPRLFESSLCVSRGALIPAATSAPWPSPQLLQGDFPRRAGTRGSKSTIPKHQNQRESHVSALTAQPASRHSPGTTSDPSLHLQNQIFSQFVHLTSKQRETHQGGVTQELSVRPSPSRQQRLQPALGCVPLRRHVTSQGASRCQPRPCVVPGGKEPLGERVQDSGTGTLALSHTDKPRGGRAVTMTSERQVLRLAEPAGLEADARESHRLQRWCPRTTNDGRENKLSSSHDYIQRGNVPSHSIVFNLHLAQHKSVVQQYKYNRGS